jgi:hypothetical protein
MIGLRRGADAFCVEYGLLSAIKWSRAQKGHGVHTLARCRIVSRDASYMTELICFSRFLAVVIIDFVSIR